MWRLGPTNVVDVALYRLGLRTGWHRVFRAKPASAAGPCFARCERHDPSLAPTKVWSDRPWAFGRPVGPVSSVPPDWHANLLTGARIDESDRRWDCVPTFSADVGDIKTVWEASRFDWVLTFAQQAVVGETDASSRLNAWLDDWQRRNPPYLGPNWMCGQEASIRVAHCAIAALIMGVADELPRAMEALLLTHLRRIAPVTAYARAHDNNHATSDAMGLYVGGRWLAKTASKRAVRAFSAPPESLWDSQTDGSLIQRCHR